MIGSEDEIRFPAVVVVLAESSSVRIVDVAHGIQAERVAMQWEWCTFHWTESDLEFAQNGFSLTAGFGEAAMRWAPTVVRMVVGTMRSSGGDGDGLKRVGE